MSDVPLQSVYVHGTAPSEQARLRRMNDLINAKALAQLSLTGGEKILDVGSGLGSFLRCMAKAAGAQGLVVGVELDARQIEEAHRLARAEDTGGSWQIRQGDAYELPLAPEEWGSFDLVHSRFLLEHLRDPLAAVQSMVRAARPKGRIVLADDDHDVFRMWPDCEPFVKLWNAYVKTYELIGNDPYIGRKLVDLLAQAGAVPVQNDLQFFGACRGNEHFATMAANVWGVVETAQARILSAKLVTFAEWEAGKAALQVWKDGPGASFWYPICWAMGLRPG